MADKPQVIKLAQPGIDVKTAGDDKLVYNSNWPLLKIYKQGSFTVTDWNTNHQLVTNHDLGYVPMFWIFTNNTLATWDAGPNANEDRSDFNGPVPGGFYVAVNDKGMYVEINTGNLVSGTFRFYYYIFALDITKPYTAPKIKSGGVIGPRNTNTVFKLAKPGKDISSSSLEDYVVHSDARSPLIHSVAPFTVGLDASIVGGSGFTYYHNLGYVPIFFYYLSTDNSPFAVNSVVPGAYRLIVLESGGNPGLSVDEQKIQYNELGAGKASLVVLKDPFNLDASVSVTV